MIPDLKWDERGLVPAIVQDWQTGQVLMLAYVNREALERTLATGQAHFWSRSRGELWHKGATSGHYQAIKKIRYDCDADTLLFQVEQTGAACHTGERSCFFREILPDVDGANTARAVGRGWRRRRRDDRVRRHVLGGSPRFTGETQAAYPPPDHLPPILTAGRTS